MSLKVGRLCAAGEYDDPVYQLTIDDLTYSYDANKPNQLVKVFDSANNPKGFIDDSDGISDSEDDYAYDDNGNMVRDDNKGIIEIKYNHLNLPTVITFASGKTISYLYNAIGKKAQKTADEYVGGIVGYQTKTSDYLAGGFQYKDGILLFFPHAEGYVNVIGDKFFYVFNYTDHLGNIRLSYGLDPDLNVLKILEENNYYPFGLKQMNYNISRKTYIKTGLDNVVLTSCETCPKEYKYKYNGKELQDELGLNMYDYGARNYDPAIGRWMNIDPLAETSTRFSPYTYAMNNPVYFIDPDGMQADATYGIKDNGEVKKLDDKKYYDKNGKEVDKLYAIDNKDNKKDVNKSGSVDDGDSVQASAGLIGQMENKRAGSEKNAEGGYFSSVGEQSATHEKDYEALFKFMSDNSKVEFSLTSFEHNGKDLIELSTFHDSEKAPSPIQRGIANSDVHKTKHSHPGIDTRPVQERASMGDNGSGGIRTDRYSDFYNARERNTTYPNHVYFPRSSRLYNVSTNGITPVK